MRENIDRIAGEFAAALQRAWNAGDAQGFADHFAQDADFVHILGGHGRGRAAIAQAHRALFSGIYRGSCVSFEVAGVRPLGSDALIVLLAQTLRFGAGEATHEMTCRPTLVLHRQEGGWSIVLMQNTRKAESTPDALAGHPFAPGRQLELTP
jgi:uncharacterized protein (TIGR02246 family)